VRVVGYLAGFFLIAAIVILGFWLVLFWRGEVFPGIKNELVDNQATTAYHRLVISDDELAAQVGIRVTQVAVTGGGLVELRFLVIDPDKANAIQDEAGPPVIVDEATGLVVDRLMKGYSRTESFQAGVTYYLTFENPGNRVHPGDKVSVLLGNTELDHVDVH
jgi:hypothetical protein